jgi:hypothetical protein
MVFEFEDEKGKKFTEVVTKRKVPALVQTTMHQVRGNIHICPDERLKNELDRDELFLALTEADILDADGKVAHHTDFLAVRRAQIIWIMPDDGKMKK